MKNQQNAPAIIDRIVLAPFEDRILRKQQLLDMVPLSLDTIERLVKKGKFPAPVKLSEFAIGWRLSDVQKWIAERKAVAA